jgi:hypothetical protein
MEVVRSGATAAESFGDKTAVEEAVSVAWGPVAEAPLEARGVSKY